MQYCIICFRFFALYSYQIPPTSLFLCDLTKSLIYQFVLSLLQASPFIYSLIILHACVYCVIYSFAIFATVSNMCDFCNKTVTTYYLLGIFLQLIGYSFRPFILVKLQ